MNITQLNRLSLTESNQVSSSQIRSELSSGPKKMHARIKGDFLNPKDYFCTSEFWDYAPPDAFEDWHFCISRLQTKTKVISRIFIGTASGALVDELGYGYYKVRSNEYYAVNNKSLHLSFKNENDIEKWQKISENEFGIEHEKVPFTRVISVVKSAEGEAELKTIMQKFMTDSKYSQVKEHVYVQLLDLPKNENEQQEQFRQWEVLKSNFRALFNMIDTAIIENEPILIHCTAGRHRSVAILIAYLVDRLGLTVHEGFAYVRSKRGCAVDYERSEFSQWLSDWAEKRLFI